MFVFTCLCLTKAWSFAEPGHAISRYAPGHNSASSGIGRAGVGLEIAPGAPEYSADVEGASRYTNDVHPEGAKWRPLNTI